MSKRTERKSITWSAEQDEQAQKIIEAFGDEMRKMEIFTRTATRPDGSEGANISGLIQFMMSKFADMADQKSVDRQSVR